MPWTAEKVGVVKDRDQIAVTVRYSDGAKSFEEIYKASGTVGSTWIQDIVANKILNLEANDALTVLPGPVTPTPTVPPDEAFLAFRRDIAILPTVDILVRLGIVEKTHVKVVALGQRIAAALPAYWGRIIDER